MVLWLLSLCVCGVGADVAWCGVSHVAGGH